MARKKTDTIEKDTTPLANKEALVAEKSALAAEKAEPAAKKTSSTTKRSASTAKKAETAEKKAASTVKEAAPVEEKAAAAGKAKPAAKRTASGAKKTASAEKKTALTDEKAATAVEKAKPAAKKAASTSKKAASAAKKTAPAEEKTEAAVEKTAPVIEDAPAPIVDEATPAVEMPVPVAEEPAPVADEPVSIVEKAAPTAEDSPAAEAVAVKAVPAEEPAVVEEPPVAEEPSPVVEAAAAPVLEEPAPVVEEPAPVVEMPDMPRRSIAFIGSECHPFVKTGGLGDVMYALPRELARLNCDVRVILPRYACIPQEYQNKMVYRGEFYMDLGKTGRNYYVGIMEYICDGVVYDFIDNQEFFTSGNPYTNLVDDIPKYCFFAKAALAALNYMNWIPDIVHCHDWQAALVPVYLRTLFHDTPVGRAKSVLTIHNLRFQGVYNIPTIKYWSGLPGSVFNMGALQQDYVEANMLKGGLAYADRITTVSGTYAQEIQTAEYGERLEEHLRYHNWKLRGIVNGIDYEMWNPETDPALVENYGLGNVLEHKMANKRALQRELGLEEDESKFVIGLISRLTNQKGLDLVSSIIPQVLDGNTQVIILGTGDKQYEDTFRYYEGAYRGTFCACIQYDEARAHRIYAGADALMVPSRFEPCGLTQLNAMHYGTLPIVRETGGLKDTVEPYNNFTGDGNGFTFDRYDAGLLLDAINRAKTVYFTNRYHWDEVVQRDMAKDVSWTRSARQYKNLYLELTQW